MKKLMIPVVLLLVFSALNIASQVNQDWAKRYSGPGNNDDIVTSMDVDDDGNVYVTGRSAGSGTMNDYITIKYNYYGDIDWVERYNDPANLDDNAYSIVVDNAGNVYVTGGSQGNTGTNWDFVTIKYNSFGVQQWIRRYNGPQNGDDIAYDIKVDTLGNVYVFGERAGISLLSDLATIKYNDAGILLWEAVYNGPANDYEYASKLVLDVSGNAYVTGLSKGPGTNYDYVTIKYNSYGMQQWASRYNGPGNGNDIPNSIAVDNTGNVYVTGESAGSGTNQDYATIKYNSLGTQQWVMRYNGPGNDFDAARTIKADAQGNVAVTGESTGNGTMTDITTIKYSSIGSVLWFAAYAGKDIDGAYSLAIDTSLNVYVTGGSKTLISNFDYITLKYNSSGVQQWLINYNGLADSIDIAGSIAVDRWGNVIVAGWSAEINSGFDFATIKYSQLIGIKTISNEIPNEYSLSQNYPNPFNPSTKIKFSIPLDSRLRPVERHGIFNGNDKVVLRIYDGLGREIETIVDEQLQPGTYEVEFDGANISSGLYFYKIISGLYSETKKMVLMK